MKKFKLIVPSFVALIFCMLLIAGSTFALFTSQASANIAVTSGKVQISATLGEPKLYSADATLTSGDLAGTITESTKTDDNESYANYAGTYYFKQQTGTFANGGTAVVANNTLTLSKMTPGDKAEAGLAIVNSSNVNIKYRLILEAHASGKNDDNVDNADLLSVLKVTFFDKTYTGLSKFVSAWMFREAVETPENLDTGLVIELPLLTDNHYQDLEVSYTITVEAVQGNAKTVDAGLTEYVDKPATQTGTDSTKVEAAQTEPVVLETNTAPQEEKTTKAEFTGAFEVAEQGSDVKLDVETASFETASQTSYTVVADEATPVASVDLNLTVDGKNVSNFKEGGSSKITTYIVKGLNTVSIVYNGDNTKAFGAGQTTSRKDSEAAVTAVGDYFYDSETGRLVFVTDHFSEYVPVTEDQIIGINETDNRVFTSLKKGFDEASDGCTLKLLSNATANEVINLADETEYTLNLNGKTIEVDLVEARPFVLGAETSLTVDANGGKMSLANNKAYGIFRIGYPFASLTLNGGTYDFNTPETTAIIWIGNTNNQLTYGVNVELNNLNVSCIGQFVRDGSQSGHPSYAEYDLPVNKLTVNGGNYTFNNAGVNINGSITGFNLLFTDSTFKNVNASSSIGAIAEHDGGSAEYDNCNYTVLSANSIQDWNATTVGAAYEADVTIKSGTYHGYYGISIFSSGGNLVINGGTIIGDSGYALDLYENSSQYSFGHTSTCIINGGNFTGSFRENGTVQITDNRTSNKD